MSLHREEIIGKPQGWQPEAELDHFMLCLTCGGSMDCRDLGQVMEHLHGDEVEWLNATTPLA